MEPATKVCQKRLLGRFLNVVSDMTEAEPSGGRVNDKASGDLMRVECHCLTHCVGGGGTNGSVTTLMFSTARNCKFQFTP